LAEKISALAKAKRVVWLSSEKSEVVDSFKGQLLQIPMRTHIEKNGTYVNYAGVAQTVKPVVVVVPKAMTLTEVADVLSGRDVKREETPANLGRRVQNEATLERGAL
jgi:NADH-quinone oxidoreductase subunit G